MTRHYINEGFEQAIAGLPQYVVNWFNLRYPKFKDDISYHNDSWPNFYVAQHCDCNGVIRPVILSLTAEANGDEEPAGFSVRLANYDTDDMDTVCLDGSEDELLTVTSEYAEDIAWPMVIAMVDAFMKIDDGYLYSLSPLLGRPD